MQRHALVYSRLVQGKRMRFVCCISISGHYFKNTTLHWQHNERDESQITSVSSLCSNADQRKHQISTSMTFVREIHRQQRWIPPRKGQQLRNVYIWWRHHERNFRRSRSASTCDNSNCEKIFIHRMAVCNDWVARGVIVNLLEVSKIQLDLQSPHFIWDDLPAAHIVRYNIIFVCVLISLNTDRL